MDLSLIYKALADGQVDVIAGDATSAQIDALDLAALDDSLITSRRTSGAGGPDRRAVRHPEIGRAMARLGGAGDRAGHARDEPCGRLDRRDPREVAAGFLAGLK